uniref:EAL domain-containing protein n=1 Tax=Pseudomonas viridiflava TaxID=33069 RepID=UPI000F017419
LQLRVIAEGVEFESQAMLLSGEGVVHGQGWLFSRPVSAAALIEMVNGEGYMDAPEKGAA